MPTLPATTVLDSLAASTTGVPPSSLAANATATANALRVVCAWPVSGQYGPGSRILYYVLVAACVVARKTEWLRNACLAAALLFPAVGAVHAIVLASLHIDGNLSSSIAPRSPPLMAPGQAPLTWTFTEPSSSARSGS